MSRLPSNTTLDLVLGTTLLGLSFLEPDCRSVCEGGAAVVALYKKGEFAGAKYPALKKAESFGSGVSPSSCLLLVCKINKCRVPPFCCSAQRGRNSPRGR